MLQQHPHLSEQVLHKPNRVSLFVLTRDVAGEPLENTQTHVWTKNVGNKKSSQIWFRAVRLGSAENHSGEGGRGTNAHSAFGFRLEIRMSVA